MVFIFTALRRLGRGTWSRLFEVGFYVGLMSWDFSLAFVNIFTFKRKIGQVTPKGKPGEGGVWPEYIPPREGDSRCSCPGLNTMANHGTLRPSLYRESTRSISKVSSHATGAIFLLRSSPARSTPLTTFRHHSASIRCATSRISSTGRTALGGLTWRTSMYTTGLNTMLR